MDSDEPYRQQDADDRWPCVCGCGQTTFKRFAMGHDPGFYKRLLLAAGNGDEKTAELYDFMHGNNDKETYLEQRRRAAEFIGKPNG